MEERTHEQNVTMAQSNWNPNMQTQNSYRNQGSQSREAPVQNVSWNRGTQEMPWDEREKNRGTQWRRKSHYFRIFRLIFSNSFPPRVLWVRSLLLLPADAFFRYCPGVQPLC